MKIKLRNKSSKIKYLDLKYMYTIGEKFLRKSTNLIRWITGEPEPEVWVGVIGGEVLAHFLQGGHPGHSQVTVL